MARELEKAEFQIETEDALVLASLGYKQEFKREFNSLSLFCVAFSIMGVLASVSASLQYPMSLGSSASMVYGWPVASLFVICVALSLAELCSAMPAGGGVYFYASKMSQGSGDAGERRMALITWMTGWFNVLGNVALVASIDWSLTQMIFAEVTLATDNAFVPTTAQCLGLYYAILVVHGLVGSLPTQILAVVNNFYVLLNLVSTVVVIVCLFALPSERNSAEWVFTHYDASPSGWNAGFAFFLGMLNAVWTMSGYAGAANIAEESRNANRAGPKAIILSVISTAVAGWLLLLAVCFSVKDVDAVLSSPLQMPMAQVMYDACGKQATLGLWFLVILVQLFTGSAAVIATSRVIFAFSRDNGIPMARWWKKVNKTTQTPINAVWLNILGSALLGLLGLISMTVLNAVFNLASISLYISYAIPIFCRITIGRKHFVPGPFHLGRWATPIGAIASLWTLFISVIFLFPYSLPVTPTNANYAVAVLGLIILLAGTWFALSAKNWFRGPLATVEYDQPSSDSSMDEKDSMKDAPIKMAS
ncbi:amino acid transporter [Gongronella butleri]|nr:amino acid transporter [Gongronella butleri]